ncbi:MAG: hypothetical protein ACRESW_05040 [Nevskiales bacterium]
MPLKINVDERSQVFQFPTGKSYTVFLELPPHRSDRLIAVRSWCDCAGFQMAGTIFVPIAVILDTQLEEKATLSFVTQPPKQTTILASPASYYATHALAPEYRYVVIYTDPAWFGQTAPDIREVRAIPGGALVTTRSYGTLEQTQVTLFPGGAAVDIPVKGSAVGSIEVELLGP